MSVKDKLSHIIIASLIAIMIMVFLALIALAFNGIIIATIALILYIFGYTYPLEYYLIATIILALARYVFSNNKR